VGVEKARYPGHAGEATVHNPFKDLQEGLEEQDDPEGGGLIIAWLAWFIQDNAISLFRRGGVVDVAEKRGEEIKYEVQSDFVNAFPDGVGPCQGQGLMRGTTGPTPCLSPPLPAPGRP